MSGATQQQISGCEGAKDHHQAAEEKAGDAEAAVDVRAPGGDQGGLGNQEKDPSGECGTVNVDDQTGQWRAENASKKIRARKTDKHGEEHQQRGGRKKVMIVTAAGKAGCRLHGCDWLSGGCSHSASVKAWMDGDRLPGN